MINLTQEVARIEREVTTLRLNLLMHLLNKKLKAVKDVFQKIALNRIESGLSNNSDTVIWFLGNRECAERIKSLIDLTFPKHRLQIQVSNATLEEVQAAAERGDVNLYCDWR